MDIFSPASNERPPNSELGFAQGTVVAWNAITGTNQISMRGALLDNLPSLIGSEVGLIRPGDVVALIRFQTTFFVLGRIEVADAAQRAFGVASQRVTGPGSAVSTASTSFVALSGGPSVTLRIGSTRRCRVELSSYMNGHDAIAYAGFRVTGASTIAPINRWSVAVGAASSGGIVPDVWANSTRVINLSAADGLNEGDNTFTMEYQCVGNPVGGLAQFSDREIAVQPF
jgi:hypothetical protein